VSYHLETCPNDGAYPLAADHGLQEGLTKRELFAAMAMQGLIGTFDARQDTDRSLANASVIIADALIAALSKEPKP
jgi:hypothetical protein